MREYTAQGFLPFLVALVALLLTIPNAVPGTWAASHRDVVERQMSLFQEDAA